MHLPSPRIAKTRGVSPESLCVQKRFSQRLLLTSPEDSTIAGFLILPRLEDPSACRTEEEGLTSAAVLGTGDETRKVETIAKIERTAKMGCTRLFLTQLSYHWRATRAIAKCESIQTMKPHRQTERLASAASLTKPGCVDHRFRGEGCKEASINFPLDKLFRAFYSSNVLAQ